MLKKSFPGLFSSLGKKRGFCLATFFKHLTGFEKWRYVPVPLDFQQRAESAAVEPARPLLLFFDPVTGRKRQARRHATEKERLEKRLFCAACRHPVTHQDARISVQGAHEHACTNPLGLSFHIGCYREAGGCALTGAATSEHSWFRGYAWRIAHCAHCRAHLGWAFESASDGFYGLILDRLTSAGAA